MGQEIKNIDSGGIDEQQMIDVLKTSLYPGASDAGVKMILAYCQATKLDPMQKPVHIVPMWDKTTGSMRDVVMPGIGLYRIQAARSGEYAGVTEPEFGNDVTENLGGTDIIYPSWCKVTVKRRLPDGAIAEFTAVERWKENYAQRGGKERSIAPNAMWLKRPYGQIAKCAEAQALRKAFPEVGAQPTAEEMEGKQFERDITQEAEVVEQIKELPPYPDDKFDQNFSGWMAAVESGKKTAQQIEAMVSTKYTLTEDQKSMISTLGDEV